MAENVTLTGLQSLTNQTTAINAINGNNTAISNAFLDVLSRSGGAPNQMEAPLDMNSNRIINLVTPVSVSEPVTLDYLNQVLTGTSLNTGTTNVPVSAAMQPVVNASTINAANILLGNSFSTPEQFGAVGNGIADDTVAVQNAVNSCQTTGNILMLRSVYLVGQINVTSSITIYGASPLSSLSIKTGNNGLVISIPTGSEVTLYNFIINYVTPQASNAGVIALLFTCSTAGAFAQFQMQNISINNACTALNVNNATSSAIMNCVFTNFSSTGITWSATANSDGGDCTLYGNLFVGANLINCEAILILSGGGLRITNNKILQAAIGIDYQLASTGNSSLLLIEGNSIEDVSSNCIRMLRQASSVAFVNVVISGNELQPNSGAIAIFVPNDSSGIWLQTINISNNIGTISVGGGGATFINVDSIAAFNISNNVVVAGGSGGVTKVIVGSASDTGVVGPNVGRGNILASQINSTNTTTIAPT